MPTRDSYAADPAAGDVLTATNFKKLPGGWIGYVENTADQTTSGTTPLTISTLSTPVDATRRLRLTLMAYRINFSVAGDAFEFGFTFDGGAAGGNLHVKRQNTGDTDGLVFVRHVATVAAGNKTITCAVTRASGTGTLTVVASAANPLLMLIEDLGGS